LPVCKRGSEAESERLTNLYSLSRLLDGSRRETSACKSFPVLSLTSRDFSSISVHLANQCILNILSGGYKGMAFGK
jgi:hypothetical protein